MLHDSHDKTHLSSMSRHFRLLAGGVVRDVAGHTCPMEESDPPEADDSADLPPGSAAANFVAHLNAAAKRHGGNQGKLAAEMSKRLGQTIHQRAVGRYMAGKPVPKLDTLQEIADGLGVLPWELLLPVAQEHGSARNFAQRQLASLVDRYLTDDEIVSLIEVVKDAVKRKSKRASTESNVTDLGIYFAADRRRNRHIAVEGDRRERATWTEHPLEDLSPNSQQPRVMSQDSASNTDQPGSESEPGAAT